jgi:tRNA threonylcarbamoyladenosine biosynthesis protein TsaE
MSTDQLFEYQSTSEAETIAFGDRIGRRLEPGDLLLLLAPFGAGKTHLTKGIAAGLGVDPDEVNSPSFVIVNQYTAGAPWRRMPIFHADLYRIETSHDLGTVGLEECLNGDGVCIIEWAERAADWLPRERLEVEIAETGPTSRRLLLRPRGERYERLVADLMAEQKDQR